MKTIREGSGINRASDWLVALHDAPDDLELQRQFQAWIAADPAHAQDWAEITRTYGALGQIAPVHHQAREEKVVELAATRQQRRRKKDSRASSSPAHAGKRRRPLAALTTAAAAACIAVLAGPALIIKLQADYLTGTAELQTFVLPDGTTVHLGPKSALRIAYGDSQREIDLLQGEAFFEVKHDTRRPFIVTAANLKTTDIGTAFDISLGKDGTHVAVQDGRVQLDTTDRQPPLSAQLGAGDWAQVSATGEIQRGTIQPDDVASWTRGQLIVKDKPAADVIAELRPYYNGIVLLREGTLARQPLTGVYNLSNPIGAFSAIAQAQGAALQQISPWIIIISAPDTSTRAD
jgi:transmembrane sensor